MLKERGEAALLLSVSSWKFYVWKLLESKSPDKPNKKLFDSIEHLKKVSWPTAAQPLTAPPQSFVQWLEHK